MVPQEDRQKRPQRQRKLRDMVKWNNEDGTALSEMQRKQGLEAELTDIPGYACLKTLITANGSMPCIANAPLYLKATSLLAQVESQSEDNDDPFHAALSGWRPSSVNDVEYQDGLKAFATLWKELQTSPSSVPEVILRARKAYLCAVADHIHAILLPEGLVDPIGPDGAFTLNEKDQHQEEKEDAKLEPDPIDIEAAEIAEILPLKIDGSKKDNKWRKLHSDGSIVAKSTFRGANQRQLKTFFLKEKQDKEMAITEEEMQKAAGIIPVHPFDCKIDSKDGSRAARKGQGIDDILRQVAKKYGSQGCNSTIFEDLLTRFVVEEDLPFSIVESPSFRNI
ncbi:hypothetical protein BT69DRAFT_1291686 [Atractiella rhizophila]|nr:hypothetical protein BT69DRAFT_1291686 [Atractiella rhizophila]